MMIVIIIIQKTDIEERKKTQEGRLQMKAAAQQQQSAAQAVPRQQCPARLPKVSLVLLTMRPHGALSPGSAGPAVLAVSLPSLLPRAGWGAEKDLNSAFTAQQ